MADLEISTPVDTLLQAASIAAFVAILESSFVRKGSVDLASGTQSYDVVFATPLASPPPASAIFLQHATPDEDGEVFFASVDESSITENGFTFWLNGVPSVSAGKVGYRVQL